MSKANRAFVRNEEAVSPVIGVILMVAITVVLAAVVFVLVSNLGEGSESAPNISFNKNSSALTLTVVTAEVAQWADFSFTTSDSTDCPVGTIDGVAPDADNRGPPNAVAAGDTVVLDPMAPGDCDGVTLTIIHVGTNSLVYTTTF